MNRLDRDTRLVGLVRARGTAQIEDLSRELGLAPSTIRRDLQRLAGSGLIIRTYGGATAAGNGAGQAPGTGARAYAEKRRIAAAAAALVEDGQTIAISSGTTAIEFARELVDRQDLTVITNSLDVAGVVVDHPGIQLVVLGGVARPRMHSLLGHLTEQACREVRADVLFMGIGAVSLERGLMNDYMPEILTDRALRGIAKTVVVIADAAKFEVLEPALVFGLEEVDVIVTDSGIDPAVVRELSARGIRVIVA
jgi:DeoR/GlpR family transcriptional regulator of sugar metabolism